jgi:WD40 repeat protein
VIASVDGDMILLREVVSQRLALTIHGQASIFSLAYSPDGRQLASAELGNMIHIWDSVSGEMLQEMSWPGPLNRPAPPNTYISSLAFNPQGNLLAAGRSDAYVTLWGMPDGQFLQPLDGHSRAVTCVAFNPKGNRLASGSLDATVRIWPLDLP